MSKMLDIVWNMSSILVIMDSVLDGESQMSRTRLIGWTAFGVCLLGYGGFAAIMVAYKLGHLELRETLLYGGPVAVMSLMMRFAMK